MSTVIKWHAIRPWNGSRNGGFEELCCQLANAQRPTGSRFTRKGTPDAGVECFVTLEDGSEWGWQSKFFDTLGDSQWNQLDRSVETALEKHPELRRYYVCVPKDRPDGRLNEQKSALDRWNDRVRKWTESATKKGMKVEFVWWGSSELLEMLQQTEHAGRILFWFDTKRFDQQWFQDRVDESTKAAGPRYTPELHQDVSIAANLAAFSRDQRFFSRLLGYVVPIEKRTQELSHSGSGRTLAPTHDVPQFVIDARAVVLETMAAVTGWLRTRPQSATEQLEIDRGLVLTREAVTAGYDLASILDDWDATEAASEPAHSTPQRNERDDAMRLVRELETLQNFLKQEAKLADSRCLELSGRWGVGKTHLMCDFAKKQISAQRPVILIMGQQLTSLSEPWSQICNLLDLRETSAAELLGALEAAAQAVSTVAILIVDALNEGAGRTLWPVHLAAFLERAQRSPWIKVILTVRIPYDEILVNEVLGNNRPDQLRHHGFRGIEYDAVDSYFAHYQIELPSAPLLAPEFSNPLFLKILCEGLARSGVHSLPRESRGISDIFSFYIKKTNEQIADKLGYNPSRNLVHDALGALVGANLAARHVPLLEAEDITNTIFPASSYENSLLRHMINEGLLIETATLTQGKREDAVVIAYDRLFEHLWASTLLAKEGSEIDALLTDNQLSEGHLQALAIQAPETHGMELEELAPSVKDDPAYTSALAESFIWRSPHAFAGRSNTIVEEMLDSPEGFESFARTLVTVATIHNHPLNADFLHEKLRRATMPERDANWGIAIHRMWARESTELRRLVDWAWSTSPSTKVAPESARLASILLSWLLSSQNRFLRDRATKALTSLLRDRIPLLIELLKKFEDIDDLYIQERLLAAAYGCTMASSNFGEIGLLSNYVYERFFQKPTVPHVLLRDYARGVVERALHLGHTVREVDRIRPPYDSDWIEPPSESEIEVLKADRSKGAWDSGDPSWSENMIFHSVFDGDFAHYVIGDYGRSDWLSLQLCDPPWSAHSSNKKNALKRSHEGSPPAFDSNLIKRYVLQRVFDLGWTIDRFGHFDRFDVSPNGRSPNKAERFGKKYQWIALHEIIARISDHFQIRPDPLDDRLREYQGPWELSLRDIDPSMTARCPHENADFGAHAQNWWMTSDFSDWQSEKEAHQWISQPAHLPSPADFLISKSSDGAEWLNLDVSLQWHEPTSPDIDRYASRRRDLWLMARAYFVRSNDVNAFEKWTDSISFVGRWMPEPSRYHRLFLGEHAWSPASRYCDEQINWIRPHNACPVDIQTTSAEYNHEIHFDCSADDAFSFKIPTATLIREMGLTWSGDGSRYLDAAGELCAFDPSVNEKGPSALLVRRNALTNFTQENDLTLVWVLLGEKRELVPDASGPRPWMNIWGTFVAHGDSVRGKLKGSEKFDASEAAISVAFTQQIPTAKN